MGKWFVLSSYSLLIFMNGYAFSAISAIEDEAEEYYNVSPSTLDLFVFSFYIIYLPLAPFASWFLTKSLHKSLIGSFFMTALGIWLKVIGGHNFWIALVGQCALCSVTSIIVTAIAVIAEIWFPKGQQLLALTIGELMCFLGMGTSFLVSSKIPIDLDNWIQASFITTVMLVYVIFAREETSKKQLDLSKYFKQMRDLSKDCMHFSLAIVVGAITGLSYSFLGLLGTALHDEGILSAEAGIIGFLISVVGIFGGITVSVMEHKGVSAVTSLVLFFCACSVSMILWCMFALQLIADYIFGSLAGFFLFGIIPLGLRITTEYNKKVNEAIPTGIIFFAAQPAAFVFSYPILYAPKLGFHSLWALLALFVITCGILVVLGIIVSMKSKKEVLIDETKEQEIMAAESEEVLNK